MLIPRGIKYRELLGVLEQEGKLIELRLGVACQPLPSNPRIPSPYKAMPSDQELAGFGPRMINSSTGLGRVSLITGAASPNGFGRRTAQLLAKHGARVVVTDVPTMESMGKELVDEIKKEGGQAIW